MPEQNFKNAPRLYVEQPLGQGADISLSSEHAHYLKNVLRCQTGDMIRVFNGKDGEWAYSITELSKKAGQCKTEQHLREQTVSGAPIILYFAPVKKAQTDFIVQKATELGVDEICPVISQHSNSQNVRIDRWHNIAIEAAEQSERLSIPGIANVTGLKTALANFPENGCLYVGLERMEGDTKPPNTVKQDEPIGLIIGPEGGFSDGEIEYFKGLDRVTPMSFGENILRAETAVVAGLGILQFLRR